MYETSKSSALLIFPKEGLYSRPEELVAWYLTAGFVARPGASTEGGGNLVSLTKFVGNKEKVLKAMKYVRDARLQS